MHFMSYLQDIARIEKAAKSQKVPLVKLFRLAGINASTWNRWKNKKTAPQYAKWEQVELAERELGLDSEAA